MEPGLLTGVGNRRCRKKYVVKHQLFVKILCFVDGDDAESKTAKKSKMGGKRTSYLVSNNEFIMTSHHARNLKTMPHFFWDVGLMRKENINSKIIHTRA